MVRIDRKASIPVNIPPFHQSSWQGLDLAMQRLASLLKTAAIDPETWVNIGTMRVLSFVEGMHDIGP